MVGWIRGRAASRTFGLLRLALIAWLLVLLLLMIFENSFIFFPSRYPRGDWQPAGQAVEDAWIKSPDGVAIHGWFLEHKNPRAVVLVAHGNAGNITSRIELRASWRRSGPACSCSITAATAAARGRPTSRAFWPTPGPLAAGLPSEPRSRKREIVLFGESLGGGVQVDLAATDDARGLILLSTFSSLPDVAACHYPRWIPVRWLMRCRLDSLAKIGRYRVRCSKSTAIAIPSSRWLWRNNCSTRPPAPRNCCRSWRRPQRPSLSATMKAIGRFLDRL